MGLIGDIAGGILGGINTAYNLYTNKRDFDYQKAIQQQIFEREDTAVQRRMADLEAAGINPNLAAGSAAGAGAVVGRSSTNDVNMGSVLDTLMAKRQIEQQKIQQNNLIKEGDLLDKKNEEQELSNKLFTAQVLTSLGVPYSVTSFRGFGKNNFNINLNEGAYWSNKSSIQKLFDYQLQNQKNSADLLQKDVDWYTADKISGMALGLIGAGTGVNNWSKMFKK